MYQQLLIIYVNELWQKCRNIIPEILNNVQYSLRSTLQKFLTINSHHFEHIL